MALQQPPAQTAERRRQLAYIATFGKPGQRTTDQQIVWDDMEQFCYAYRLVTERDNSNKIDPHAPEFFDGRRSWWLRARGTIILGLAEPPTLKVTRTRKPKADA